MFHLINYFERHLFVISYDLINWMSVSLTLELCRKFTPSYRTFRTVFTNNQRALPFVNKKRKCIGVHNSDFAESVTLINAPKM